MIDDSADSEPISLESPVRLLRCFNHDLRNPLNNMNSLAEMLNQGIYGEVTPTQSDILGRIRQNGARTLRMLDDLGYYVKVESGNYTLSLKAFEPESLVQRIMETVQPFVEAKNLTMTLTHATALPDQLWGDEFVIQHVISALIWNAISFTEQGTIDIGSEWLDDQGQWCITVRDTGAGIDPAHTGRIFEPFWQGNKRKTPVPTAGCGLGLTVALAFTRLLQGSLVLQETGDTGSAFGLCFPATSVQPEG